MSWKQMLGLALSSIVLALVVWGLFFAKPPVRLMFFKIGIVNEAADGR